MRHCVCARVNYPFHGLSASMVPTTGTSPATLSQHHCPMAEATHRSVPMSEGLERCGLLGAGERRTHRGVSLWAEERLCRKEGLWHGEGGRWGVGSRALGSTSCLSLHPLVCCRWLVQRAQVLQAPGRPDDFY